MRAPHSTAAATAAAAALRRALRETSDKGGGAGGGEVGASPRKRSHRSAATGSLSVRPVSRQPRGPTAAQIASSLRPQRNRRLPLRLQQECDGSESAASQRSEPSSGATAADDAEGSEPDIGRERGPSPLVRPRMLARLLCMECIAHLLPPAVQGPVLAGGDDSVWGRRGEEREHEAVSAVWLPGRSYAAFHSGCPLAAHAARPRSPPAPPKSSHCAAFCCYSLLRGCTEEAARSQCRQGFALASLVSWCRARLGRRSVVADSS